MYEEILNKLQFHNQTDLLSFNYFLKKHSLLNVLTIIKYVF